MKIANKLYIVPTPIGNLEDITLRALKVLESVDRIACEDTRHTGLLLHHYEIKKPLFSYHKFNEKERCESILDAIENGESIALVSDAGMPGISDPGYEVIKEAVKRDINVEVLPGASASITALVKSGLPTQEFTFLGFIPRKNRERKVFMETVDHSERTLILYESIHRIKDSIRFLMERYPKRKVCVVRELTKKYEESIHGSLEEVYDQMKDRDLKGECIILLDREEEQKEMLNIKALLTEEIKNGASKSKAAKNISKAYNLNKNDVYKISLEL